MNIILYLIIAIGLVICISQLSYAIVIGGLYGMRDRISTLRLIPLQKKADLIHCAHHIVHAVCGLLLSATALAVLNASSGLSPQWPAMAAWFLLTGDTLAYIIAEKTLKLSASRDEIRLKWRSEKVFGPDHDHEVNLYRALNEITSKNLLRDCIHATGFGMIMLLG